MPPKKKGGKKGKGKKGKKGKGKKGKKGSVVDGVPAEEMSVDELLDFNQRLRDEVEQEREERNYFQLERDKINTFWEITKRQLAENKAEVRNKERQMEDAEERHQNEIKVYKQKVRHLLYEHQNSITQLKSENAVALKLAQDSHNMSEQELRKDKRQLKASMKTQELVNVETIKSVKKDNDDYVTNMRLQHERNIKELENKYAQMMETQRDELVLRKKTELHQVEEIKNERISSLIKVHEREFSDVKNYYNDITLNNIALINTLKEQLEDMKTRENRMKKEMGEMMLKNKLLVEPLSKAQKQISDLRIQLSDCLKDKDILRSTQSRLKVSLEELQIFRWENEVLHQRFEKISAERDELYSKFMISIQEVQQKCCLKNLLLEKKLSTLTETLEMKDAQLNEILSVANLDPRALSLISQKLEDALLSKNQAIKDLQYELARTCKAHNDLLKACESKLQSYGIQMDNLGFKPLKNTASGQTLGSGPAGLVSAPR